MRGFFRLRPLAVTHQKIIANPEAKAKIAVTGFDAFSGPPETLAAFVQSELANWGKLIKDAGIEAQ